MKRQQSEGSKTRTKSKKKQRISCKYSHAGIQQDDKPVADPGQETGVGIGVSIEADTRTGRGTSTRAGTGVGIGQDDKRGEDSGQGYERDSIRR